MTILQAAKKGAAWMRWWINHNECDCDGDHICGLPDRLKELREVETAIEDYKAAQKTQEGKVAE